MSRGKTKRRSRVKTQLRLHNVFEQRDIRANLLHGGSPLFELHHPDTFGRNARTVFAEPADATSLAQACTISPGLGKPNCTEQSGKKRPGIIFLV
jgi:hypothetical protein